MSEESTVNSILSTIGTSLDELVPSMARMRIIEDVIFLVALLVAGVLIAMAYRILRKTYLEQKGAGKLNWDREDAWMLITIVGVCALIIYGIFFVAQGTVWLVDIIGWCSHPKARAIETLLRSLGKS